MWRLALTCRMGDAFMSKAKILDYYQTIISRLAGNSSSVKGWAVSVGMALIGFGAKDGPRSLAYLALVPLLIFWLLDAYYLAAERVFRHEFNRIAATDGDVPMSIGGYAVTSMDILRAMFARVSYLIYLSLGAVALVIGSGLIVL